MIFYTASGVAHHLAVSHFFNGISPTSVPFGDPKGTEKVPATSDSARLTAARRRFLYNGTRPHQSFLAHLEGAPSQQVRSGYFSNILPQGHLSVIFGDSSLKGSQYSYYICRGRRSPAPRVCHYKRAMSFPGTALFFMENIKSFFAYYYNKFGQESRAASPAFPPSRA